MSDPGPLPAPKGRPRWVYAVLAVVGACLLFCCLFFVWANTFGEDFLDRVATEQAER